MKQIAIIIISILTLSGQTYAKQVVKQTAKQVAKNFFAEKADLKLSEITFGKEFVITTENRTTCFVFNINEGFIAVAGDDAVFPVLAYSFESSYTGKGFPAGFSFWMEKYSEQVEYAINHKNEASDRIKAVWGKYSDKNFTPKKGNSGVEPLLSTTWGQGCYYNTAFPEEEQGQCGHLYTGCVATAMAQIMKYYNYPESGTGSYGYNTNYGYVEADFENTVYNWNEMENHLTDENEAVATLMFHSAISLSSQFFPEGTGAYDTTVPGALFKYFKYKDDAQFLFRDEYPGDWKALLRSELDEHRPVLYGAVAEAKTLYGHSLVCDGYQDTAFFHFNWGSGGNYDGYFYLDTLTAAGLNFNKFQDAVVGIEPLANGVSDISKHPAVSVFPNPSYGEFFIDLENDNRKNAEILLFDLSGKLILRQQLNGNNENIKIDVPGLEGTFLLQVNNGDKQYFSKIILLD